MARYFYCSKDHVSTLINEDVYILADASIYHDTNGQDADMEFEGFNLGNYRFSIGGLSEKAYFDGKWNLYQNMDWKLTNSDSLQQAVSFSGDGSVYITAQTGSKEANPRQYSENDMRFHGNSLLALTSSRSEEMSKAHLANIGTKEHFWGKQFYTTAWNGTADGIAQVVSDVSPYDYTSKSGSGRKVTSAIFESSQTLTVVSDLRGLLTTEAKHYSVGYSDGNSSVANTAIDTKTLASGLSGANIMLLGNSVARIKTESRAYLKSIASRTATGNTVGAYGFLSTGAGNITFNQNLSGQTSTFAYSTTIDAINAYQVSGGLWTDTDTVGILTGNKIESVGISADNVTISVITSAMNSELSDPISVLDRSAKVDEEKAYIVNNTEGVRYQIKGSSADDGETYCLGAKLGTTTPTGDGKTDSYSSSVLSWVDQTSTCFESKQMLIQYVLKGTFETKVFSSDSAKKYTSYLGMAYDTLYYVEDGTSRAYFYEFYDSDSDDTIVAQSASTMITDSLKSYAIVSADGTSWKRQTRLNGIFELKFENGTTKYLYSTDNSSAESDNDVLRITYNSTAETFIYEYTGEDKDVLGKIVSVNEVAGENSSFFSAVDVKNNNVTFHSDVSGTSGALVFQENGTSYYCKTPLIPDADGYITISIDTNEAELDPESETRVFLLQDSSVNTTTVVNGKVAAVTATGDTEEYKTDGSFVSKYQSGYYLLYSNNRLESFLRPEDVEISGTISDDQKTYQATISSSLFGEVTKMTWSSGTENTAYSFAVSGDTVRVKLNGVTEKKPFTFFYKDANGLLKSEYVSVYDIEEDTDESGKYYYFEFRLYGAAWGEAVALFQEPRSTTLNITQKSSAGLRWTTVSEEVLVDEYGKLKTSPLFVVHTADGDVLTLKNVSLQNYTCDTTGKYTYTWVAEDDALDGLEDIDLIYLEGANSKAALLQQITTNFDSNTGVYSMIFNSNQKDLAVEQFLLDYGFYVEGAWRKNAELTAASGSKDASVYDFYNKREELIGRARYDLSSGQYNYYSVSSAGVETLLYSSNEYNTFDDGDTVFYVYTPGTETGNLTMSNPSEIGDGCYRYTIEVSGDDLLYSRPLTLDTVIYAESVGNVMAVGTPLSYTPPNIALTMTDNVIQACGIDAEKTLTISSVKSDAKIEVYFAENQILAQRNGEDTLLKDNVMNAAALSAKDITISSEFEGTLKVVAEDNTINYASTSCNNYFKAAGILAENSLNVTNDLGGTIELKYSNNNIAYRLANQSVSRRDYSLTTVSGAGIYSAGKITVGGMINTVISVTALGGDFIYGIYSGDSLSTKNFGGTITIDSTSKGDLTSGVIGIYAKSLKNPDDPKTNDNPVSSLFQISGTISIDSYNTWIYGRASVTENNLVNVCTYTCAVAVAERANILVTGTIDVSVSEDGLVLQNYKGDKPYAIRTDYGKALDVENSDDIITLAAGSVVRGFINMGGGLNDFIIDSNASYTGAVEHDSGEDNTTFLLNGNASGNAIYHVTDIHDVSLASGTTITIDCNDAVMDQEYILYDYNYDNEELLNQADARWKNANITVLFNGEAQNFTINNNYGFAKLAQGLYISVSYEDGQLKLNTFSTEEALAQEKENILSLNVNNGRIAAKEEVYRVAVPAGKYFQEEFDSDFLVIQNIADNTAISITAAKNEYDYKAYEKAKAFVPTADAQKAYDQAKYQAAQNETAGIDVAKGLFTPESYKQAESVTGGIDFAKTNYNDTAYKQAESATGNIDSAKAVYYQANYKDAQDYAGTITAGTTTAVTKYDQSKYSAAEEQAGETIEDTNKAAKGYNQVNYTTAIDQTETVCSGITKAKAGTSETRYEQATAYATTGIADAQDIYNHNNYEKAVETANTLVLARHVWTKFTVKDDNTQYAAMLDEDSKVMTAIIVDPESDNKTTYVMFDNDTDKVVKAYIYGKDCYVSKSNWNDFREENEINTYGTYNQEQYKTAIETAKTMNENNLLSAEKWTDFGVCYSAKLINNKVVTAVKSEHGAYNLYTLFDSSKESETVTGAYYSPGNSTATIINKESWGDFSVLSDTTNTYAAMLDDQGNVLTSIKQSVSTDTNKFVTYSVLDTSKIKTETISQDEWEHFQEIYKITDYGTYNQTSYEQAIKAARTAAGNNALLSDTWTELSVSGENTYAAKLVAEPDQLSISQKQWPDYKEAYGITNYGKYDQTKYQAAEVKASSYATTSKWTDFTVEGDDNIYAAKRINGSVVTAIKTEQGASAGISTLYTVFDSTQKDETVKNAYAYNNFIVAIKTDQLLDDHQLSISQTQWPDFKEAYGITYCGTYDQTNYKAAVTKAETMKKTLSAYTWTDFTIPGDTNTYSAKLIDNKVVTAIRTSQGTATMYTVFDSSEADETVKNAYYYDNKTPQGQQNSTLYTQFDSLQVKAVVTQASIETYPDLIRAYIYRDAEDPVIVYADTWTDFTIATDKKNTYSAMLDKNNNLVTAVKTVSGDKTTYTVFDREKSIPVFTQAYVYTTPTDGDPIVVANYNFIATNEDWTCFKVAGDETQYAARLDEEGNLMTAIKVQVVKDIKDISYTVTAYTVFDSGMDNTTITQTYIDVYSTKTKKTQSITLTLDDSTDAWTLFSIDTQDEVIVKPDTFATTLDDDNKVVTAIRTVSGNATTFTVFDNTYEEPVAVMAYIYLTGEKTPITVNSDEWTDFKIKDDTNTYSAKLENNEVVTAVKTEDETTTTYTVFDNATAVKAYVYRGGVTTDPLIVTTDWTDFKIKDDRNTYSAKLENNEVVTAVKTVSGNTTTYTVFNDATAVKAYVYRDGVTTDPLIVTTDWTDFTIDGDDTNTYSVKLDEDNEVITAIKITQDAKGAFYFVFDSTKETAQIQTVYYDDPNQTEIAKMTSDNWLLFMQDGVQYGTTLNADGTETKTAIVESSESGYFSIVFDDNGNITNIYTNGTKEITMDGTVYSFDTALFELNGSGTVKFTIGEDGTFAFDSSTMAYEDAKNHSTYTLEGNEGILTEYNGEVSTAGVFHGETDSGYGYTYKFAADGSIEYVKLDAQIYADRVSTAIKELDHKTGTYEGVYVKFDQDGNVKSVTVDGELLDYDGEEWFKRSVKGEDNYRFKASSDGTSEVQTDLEVKKADGEIIKNQAAFLEAYLGVLNKTGTEVATVADLTDYAINYSAPNKDSLVVTSDASLIWFADAVLDAGMDYELEYSLYNENQELLSTNTLSVSVDKAKLQELEVSGEEYKIYNVKITGIPENCSITWRVRGNPTDGTRKTAWTTGQTQLTSRVIASDISLVANRAVYSPNGAEGIHSAEARFSWEVASSVYKLERYTLEYIESNIEIKDLVFQQEIYNAMYSAENQTLDDAATIVSKYGVKIQSTAKVVQDAKTAIMGDIEDAESEAKATLEDVFNDASQNLADISFSPQDDFVKTTKISIDSYSSGVYTSTSVNVYGKAVERDDGYTVVYGLIETPAIDDEEPSYSQRFICSIYRKDVVIESASQEEDISFTREYLADMTDAASSSNIAKVIAQKCDYEGSDTKGVFAVTLEDQTYSKENVKFDLSYDKESKENKVSLAVDQSYEGYALSEDLYGNIYATGTSLVVDGREYKLSMNAEGEWKDAFLTSNDGWHTYTYEVDGTEKKVTLEAKIFEDGTMRIRHATGDFEAIKTAADEGEGAWKSVGQDGMYAKIENGKYYISFKSKNQDDSCFEMDGTYDYYNFYRKETSASEVVTSGLTDKSYVYWRVKADDVVGGTSDWADGIDFRIYIGDEEGPYWSKKPTLASNYTLSYDDNWTMTYTIDNKSGLWGWSSKDKDTNPNAIDDITGTRRYTFQYSTDGGQTYTDLYNWGVEDLFDDNGNWNTQTITVSFKDPNLYSCRIVAVDAAGNYGDNTNSIQVIAQDTDAPDGSSTTVIDKGTAWTSSNYEGYDYSFTWNAVKDPVSTKTSTKTGVSTYTIQYSYTDQKGETAYLGNLYGYTVNNDGKKVYETTAIGTATTYKCITISGTENKAGTFTIGTGSDAKTFDGFLLTTGTIDANGNITHSKEEEYCLYKDENGNLTNRTYHLTISAADKVGNITKIYDSDLKINDEKDLEPPKGSFTKMNETSVVVTAYEEIQKEVTTTDENGKTTTTTETEYGDPLSADVTFSWTDDFKDGESSENVRYIIQCSDSKTFEQNVSTTVVLLNTDGTTTLTTLNDKLSEEYTDLNYIRVDSLGNEKKVVFSNTQPTIGSGLFSGMSNVYWRVCAVDTSGNLSENWSTTETFEFKDTSTDLVIVDKGTPSVPTSLTVTSKWNDAYKIMTGELDVSWNYSNIGFGVERFKVNYADANGEGGYYYVTSLADASISSGAESTIRISDLRNDDDYLSQGKYNIIVTAFGYNGEKAESAVTEFYQDYERPTWGEDDSIKNNVDLLYLSDSTSSIGQVNVFISWNPFTDSCSGVDKYVLRYASAKNGSTNLDWTSKTYDASVTGDTLTLQEGQYYIQIIAYDKVGNASALEQKEGTEESKITISDNDVDNYVNTFAYQKAVYDESATVTESFFGQLVGASNDPCDWIIMDTGDPADNVSTGELQFTIRNLKLVSGTAKGLNIGIYDNTGALKQSYTVSMNDLSKSKSGETFRYLVNGAFGDYYLKVSVNGTGIMSYGYSSDFVPFTIDKTDDTAFTTPLSCSPGETLRGIRVGYSDSVSISKLSIEENGKYSLTVNKDTTDSNSKLTVTILKGTEGATSFKTVKSFTVNANSLSASLSNLLLDKGIYYVQVVSNNASKGANVYYDLSVVTNDCFTPDNQDDFAGNLESSYESEIPAAEIFTPAAEKVIEEWVGYKDALDFRELQFGTSGQYTFSIVKDTETLGPVTCTIYKYAKDKTALTKVSSFTAKNGTISASLSLLLDANEQYFIAATSTNASKGDSINYGVSVTADNLIIPNSENTTPAAVTDGFQAVFNKNFISSKGTMYLSVENESTETKYDGVSSDNYAVVGYGSAYSYNEVALCGKADYTFTLKQTEPSSTGSALKLNIYKANSSGNGFTSVKSLTLKSSAISSSVTVKGLAAGEYLLEVVAADASKGKSADYQIAISSKNYESDTITITSADDWSEGNYIHADEITDLTKQTQGELSLTNLTDYYTFDTGTRAGNFSFSLTGSGANSITVYSEKNGSVNLVKKYSGKTTINDVYLDAGTKYYVAVSNTTKGSLGGTYGLTIDSSDANELSYNAGEETRNYTDDDAWPMLPDYAQLDWEKASAEGLSWDSWVGYGSTLDYRTVTLEKDGAYNFNLTRTEGSDSLQMILYKKADNGYSLTQVKSVTVKTTADATTEISNLLLTAGEYYIAVKNSNAKGDSAYDVKITNTFTSVDVAADNTPADTTSVNLDKTGEFELVGNSKEKYTITTEGTESSVKGWVGYNDAYDYIKVNLGEASSGTYSFSVKADATESLVSSDSLKVTLYTVNESSNKLSQLQTVTLNSKNGFAADFKTQLLNENSTYYFVVQSPNAAKGANVDYTITSNKEEGDIVLSTRVDSTGSETNFTSGTNAYAVFTVNPNEIGTYKFTNDTTSSGYGLLSGFTLYKLNTTDGKLTKVAVSSSTGSVKLEAGDYYLGCSSEKDVKLAFDTENKIFNSSMTLA